MRQFTITRTSQIMAAITQRRQPSRAAKLSTTAFKPAKVEPPIKIKAEPEDNEPLNALKRPLPLDQTTPRKKPRAKVKLEDINKAESPPPSTSVTSRLLPDTKTNLKSESLSSRKILSYAKHAHQSPFPDFPHPTPDECALALRILTSLHGPRTRPKPAALKAPTDRAGCGNSPSVLDALVRTILSQNTSDTNSSRAKRSMDSVYGRSDNWDAIVAGGQPKLEDAIRCGGLSAVKSKVILAVLDQVRSRHGDYTLESLREIEDNDEVMRELLSFKGVGPKTASCVMLFCLGRESFAVDTHVWRISGIIGWRPKKASRDETHLHLDKRIPDEMKYPLHVLMIAHGKRCPECKAGAARVKEGSKGEAGRCKLRMAFKSEDEEAVLKGEEL